MECFTVRLYDISSLSSSVNSTRKKLFAKKGRTIENIPQTQDALGLHLKRAVYQAGYLFGVRLWFHCLCYPNMQIGDGLYVMVYGSHYG